MIKIVVFDLDDTLFPERDFVKSGFIAVNELLNTKYTIKGFFEVAWHLFTKGQRGQIFNLALETLGIKYDQSMIQEFVEIYRNHKPHIYLYKDAELAINRLQGYKHLGIITDGYLATQQNKIQSLNIQQKINTIIYTDLYGRNNWKPSPLAYLKIMEMSGCNRNECVYIGDNPNKDFVTAKKLGWLTVKIIRDHGEYSHVITPDSHEADLNIHSLLELEKIV
jgi:putative hydrolase of the HAD superfamily